MWRADVIKSDELKVLLMKDYTVKMKEMMFKL